MSGSEPQPIGADEAEAFSVACEAAFHSELHAADLALDLRTLDAARALVIRDGGEIVGTAAAIGRRLTVPGGASVPAAAVTAVGVLPGHTRRGHMRALMERQLADIRAAGEPVACLWSSEAGIYNRFGYGPATQAVGLTVRTPAALRPDAPAGAVRPRLVEPDPAALAGVYDAARRPGMFDRPAVWWERRVYYPDHRRDGASPLRCALIPGAGYALYSVATRWGEHGPDGEARLRELVAVTPEATADLWRELLGLDLVRSVTARLAPAGDPLVHLVALPDAVSARHRDGLWVRLVDVAAALAARTYAMPFSLVLDVDDAFCGRNTGTYRLSSDGAAASCVPSAGTPDLAVTAEALGAAYLGGTSLATLAAAGQVRELRAGALRTAAAAFRDVVEPWCPEIF